LGANVTSHDAFLKAHFDSLSAANLNKFEWFHDVNGRAIQRILANLSEMAKPRIHYISTFMSDGRV